MASEYVYMQYRLPRELHHAAKTVAAARRMTLKAFLLVALSNEVAKGYAPAREPGAARG